MFHNILVAVDGSPDADRALAQAIDLAESEHARLTLITASRDPRHRLSRRPARKSPLVADNQAEAEAVLRRARERVPEDLPVTTVLTDQPIRTALIRQIKTATTTSSSWARAAAAPSARRCSAASATTS